MFPTCVAIRLYPVQHLGHKKNSKYSSLISHSIDLYGKVPGREGVGEEASYTV